MANTMDKLRELADNLKGYAEDLRRDGAYRCCMGTYEHVVALIDAILRESEAQGDETGALAHAQICESLGDAQTDPVLQAALWDAAALLREQNAQIGRMNALEAERVVAASATPRTGSAMSEVKPVAAVETLARYEPDIRYIGTGEYVAECVHADGGDYYLAADVDAAVEALRVEVMGLTARAERAEARVAELKLLLDMLCGTIETHEIESLSCDRDGNYYCECLREQTARTRAAIDQQLAATQGGEAS